MKKISLQKWGPIISDSEAGEEIYSILNNSLIENELIEVDFSSINSMATFNAKQIFGRIYINIGAEDFFKKVELKNVSQDLKIIIKMGILDAIEDNNK